MSYAIIFIIYRWIDDIYEDRVGDTALDLNGVIGNQRYTLFAPISTIIGPSCLEVVGRWKLLRQSLRQAEKKDF